MELLVLEEYGITSPELVKYGVVDRSSVDEDMPEELLVPLEKTGHPPALIKGYAEDYMAKEIDLNSRSFPFIASARTVDRDGDVVLPSGLKLQDFRKNPVVLLNHDN